MVRMMKTNALIGLFALLALPGRVLALEDVTLTNVKIVDDQSTLLFPRIEVTATNLSRDEVSQLFSTATPKDVVTTLLEKMEAARLYIPEGQLMEKDGKATLRAISAAKINRGKFEKFDFAGLDASFTLDKRGSGIIKMNALSLDQGDVSGLFEALRTGRPEGMTLSLGKINWAGFEVSVPDEETSPTAPGGNLIKVSLGSAIGENKFEGKIPVSGFVEIKNMIVVMPPSSEPAQMLKEYGYDKLDLSFVTQFTYDPVKRSQKLEKMDISMANAGTLGLSGQFGNIDFDALSKGDAATLMALMDLEVSTFEMRFLNAGLAEKGLSFFAASQKKSADAARQELSAMASGMLPMLLGGNPAGRKLADAVAAFITTPKSLVINLKAKGKPLKVQDMAELTDPVSFFTRVDVEAQANR